MFRSYAPELFPWFLTSPEARFLTAAIEQLLDVAPRVRDDENILHGENDEDFLVRVTREENNHVIWKDKIARVPKPEKKAVAPQPLDPRRIEALNELTQVTNIIEIELTMLPMPVREKKDRPFFPYLRMLAESNSGMILGNDMLQPLPSLEAMRAELAIKVADHLLRLGVRPVTIAVRTETTAQSLAPLASELGIHIRQSPKLLALDAALKFMGRISPF